MMTDPSLLTDEELRAKYPRFAWKLVDTRKMTMTEARRRFQMFYEAIRPKTRAELEAKRQEMTKNV